MTGWWYIICSGGQKAERDRAVGLQVGTRSEDQVFTTGGRKEGSERAGQGDGKVRDAREVVRKVQVEVGVDRSVKK